jgi:hypothetical protein
MNGKSEREFPTDLYMYINFNTKVINISNGTSFVLKNYKPHALANGLVGWEATAKDDDGSRLNFLSIELIYPNSGKWTVIITCKKYEIIYILSEIR